MNELIIRRKEIKLEEKRLLLEAVQPVVSTLQNPAVIFVALWIGIDWLSNHGKTYVDKDGNVQPMIDPSTRKPHAYLTPASAERLAVPLAAGFVANAFGGAAGIGAGLGSIIKAVK